MIQNQHKVHIGTCFVKKNQKVYLATCSFDLVTHDQRGLLRNLKPSIVQMQYVLWFMDSYSSTNKISSEVCVIEGDSYICIID